MRVGDIITDGSVKWVVRHIDHPKAGVIVDWQSTTSMGDGFLKCTGAGIDPNIYPLLKNILPLVGGKLILPDRRGVVPRGLDDGRGLDVGRLLGSYQDDAIRNIAGTFGGSLCIDNTTTNRYAIYHQGTGVFSSKNQGTNVIQSLVGAPVYRNDILSIIEFSSDKTVPTAAENRMKNVATTYWICYA